MISSSVALVCLEILGLEAHFVIGGFSERNRKQKYNLIRLKIQDYYNDL